MPESKVCSRFAVVTRESTLTFDAKSTLHNVHGSVTDLAGYVEAAWNDDGTVASDPPPRMHVEFGVQRLRSGNDLQDREMWRLIDSGRFPMVAADLREIGPGAVTERYSAGGDITLAGRTRRYTGEISLRKDGEGIVVDGGLVVDIRDFGLKAPQLLFIKVDPQVKVTLHLVAALAG